MIIKSLSASFAITLTSALEICRGHELLVFLGLYVIHLLASRFLLSRVRHQPVALPAGTRRSIDAWAESQHASFTSF